MIPALLATVPALKRAVARHGAAAALPITTYLLMVCFGLGLPAVVGIYPQYGTIEASKLEVEFQQVPYIVVDAGGGLDRAASIALPPGERELRTHFLYDKGL